MTVESPYGNPKGAGWYDTGTTATISIQTFILGFPSAKELAAWIVNGKALPPSQTLTIAVNGLVKVKSEMA